MDKRKENIVVNKTLSFATIIILLADQLIEKKRYNIANQLSRAATSIGANVWEAQNAESLKDFIHKLKIAAK
jgi:four helix bundle protein